MSDLVGGAPGDLPRDDLRGEGSEQERGRARRRFVGLAAAGLAAAATGGWLGSRALRGGRPWQPRRRGDVGAAAALNLPGVVVEATHPRAVDSGGRPDAAAIRAMLDGAMARLTGKPDAAAAWATLFSPDDVIAIKVNCLPAPPLATHPEIVTAIISGLRAAGVPDGNIIIYDRLTRELERAGFSPNTRSGVRCFGSDQSGYDAEPTEAGVVGCCLSRIVSEMCTAVINVPVVKDHDLAGISIALKNHFGSINNPNKQHQNHCCPQVADVNLLAPIRAKQRLVIADALIVTYDGGPAYKPAGSTRLKTILAATDPVALDAVGHDIIERLRRGAGLPTLAAEDRAPKYIAVAADGDHQLGVADISRIRQLNCDLAQGKSR